MAEPERWFDIVPDHIEIQPTGPLQAAIRPPGSKSITNRALICAAAAKGRSVIRGGLLSEDTRVMIDALNRLGAKAVFGGERGEAAVVGCGGPLPAASGDLYVANSGTTMRFLTALLAAGRGAYRLDGAPRMRQRPIQDLLSGLSQLGGDVRSEKLNGYPPVVVRAAGLRGGRAIIAGDASSQFVSGLLMAAPLAEHDVELIVEGPLVSQPYVHMTVGVMASFGVRVDTYGSRRFFIPAPQAYLAAEYDVEPDASAASYFWGAAAVTGGSVVVQGLTRESLQGDVAFCQCLAQMGCQVAYENSGIRVSGGPLRGISVDMNAISDTVQTLAAVALLAEGPTTITGVGHIRHKETDRIGDLARELRKLGAAVDELTDGLRIAPGPLRGAEIETYGDHRMAMSLALVGLRVPGVVIRDPDCTQKTYPGFFRDLQSLSSFA